jgi:zinc protease
MKLQIQALGRLMAAAGFLCILQTALVAAPSAPTPPPLKTPAPTPSGNRPWFFFGLFDKPSPTPSPSPSAKPPKKIKRPDTEKREGDSVNTGAVNRAETPASENDLEGALPTGLPTPLPNRTADAMPSTPINNSGEQSSTPRSIPITDAPPIRSEPVRPESTKKIATPAATPAAPKEIVIDRTTRPASAPLPPITLPVPVRETLANGLKVLVLPDHNQPTLTYRLMIKSGGLYDGPKPGLAEVTASMLNKGTNELSAEEFAQKTDFLGTTVEAKADDDCIVITAEGLSRYNSELLQFLRDAALNPAFREDELNLEKINTVSQLIQNKQESKELASQLQHRLIFGRHPYGAFATPESVQSIEREDVVKFHKTHFVPNNATLVLVGDVEPTNALTQIRAVFEDWQSAELPKFRLPAFPKSQGISYHLINRPGSVQSNILVTAPGIPGNDPNATEINVLNSVLGGSFSGRLFNNLREVHGYTYGSYSSFNQEKLGGSFEATAEVQTAVTVPAIQEILKELKRITEEKIPEAELSLQKNYLIGNFLLSLENNLRTATRLQKLDLYNLPEDYYKTVPKRMAAITPEMALDLAKKVIHLDKMQVIVVGDAKAVLPELKKMGPVTVYDTEIKQTSEVPMAAASAD